MTSIYLKRVRSILVFLFILIALNEVKLHAQTDPLIDSLKILLQNTKNDSLVAAYNNSLLKLYAPIQQDSAIMFGERAKELATKLSNGYLLATNILNFGALYWHQSDMTKAMDCFTRAAAMYDSLGYEKDIAYARSNIGIIYMLYGELSKAEPYFRESIIINKKYDDELGMAHSLHYLGFVKHSLKEYDSAIYFTSNALKLFEKTKYLTGQAWATSGLGECYKELGDFAKARDYLVRSMKIEELQGNRTGAVRSRIAIGSLEKALGNYERAEKYYEEVSHLDEIQDNPTERLALFNEWVDLYVKMGNYKLAYDTQKKLIIANDSFRVRENRAQLDEINEKYETAQKEAKIVSLEEQKRIQELEIQQKRNQNTILIIAAGILLTVAIFITLLLLQIKKRKKEVESRNEIITKINKALNKSQDELLLSNKTKDKFFALIAHDLRGPITSLQGIGRMLDYYSRKGDENRIQQLISQVDQSAQSVNHLLDNLLKWALSQTNGLIYNPSVFAMGRLVDECTIIFEENLKAKQITLNKDIHEEVMVEADYNMISTVLRNLLSNALKFSPSGGTITLTTAMQDEHLEIIIIDTGSGIPEQTLAALRQKQALKSTQGTQNEKGTGLGLTLCQEFISKHGADLDISSSSEGTRIAFTLKMTKERALA